MITYNISTGNLYKDWTTEIEATVGDSSLSFAEHLYNQELNVGITARILTVNNVTAFEEATKTSLEDLNVFLSTKNSNGKLSIEHLQRLCERHVISYELTGDRPATAHRKYVKMMRDTYYDRQYKGYWLCEKAKHRILGNIPGTPRDHQKAVELFEKAIKIGYLPSYAKLAKFYKDENRDKEAVEIAERGVKLGDADSMIELARILTDQPRPDYKRPAKLYMDAAEKGLYNKAALGLHKLISDGHFTPKSDLYMKLIRIVARRNILLKDTIANHPLFDPDLVVPRNMLLEDNPDISTARQMLTGVLKKGKTQAYGGLAKCDILEKRWGSAAENVMKGIETGDTSTCLVYATRLALMGADFANFTDKLGTPDYEAVLKWCKECIDEDLTYGFQMLYHLADIGVLKMEDIDAPELAERCSHFVNNVPEDERADIYCESFDGKRQPK